MDVRNCRNCGRLFNYIGGAPLCPACSRKIEEKFQVVKQYIYDNPSATIQQVSEDNEVSIQQINKWIREERLSFSADSVVGIECENCGAMIKTGRFCQPCKDRLATTLGSVYPKHATVVQRDSRENAKMRFLDVDQ